MISVDYREKCTVYMYLKTHIVPKLRQNRLKHLFLQRNRIMSERKDIMNVIMFGRNDMPSLQYSNTMNQIQLLVSLYHTNGYSFFHTVQTNTVIYMGEAVYPIPCFGRFQFCAISRNDRECRRNTLTRAATISEDLGLNKVKFRRFPSLNVTSLK